MRRLLLMGLALAATIGVSALALQQRGPDGQPGLGWVRKASAGPERVAILLEMGLKDNDARDWSGTATVTGAQVVHREGYRFRKLDELEGTSAWKASSHRALRAVKSNPVIAKIEPIATVGVVWHLQDVKEGAKLALELKSGEKAEVHVADVRKGQLQSLWNGQAVVRLVTTAEGIATGPNEDDMPAAAYGPDGTLWVAYSSYRVLEEERRIEPPMLKEAPADFKKYYTPEFGDQVKARAFRDGKWSEEIAITGPRESLCGTAIAVDGRGVVHVAYSTFRDMSQHVWTREIRSKDGKIDLGPEIRQGGPATEESALWPVMTTDVRGDCVLAYQAWARGGPSALHVLKRSQAGGAWTYLLQRSVAGNAWHPSLAAGPRGEIAVVFDAYLHGNYDVLALIASATNPAGDLLPLASSPQFEARPSAVYDGDGRLWVAYEEGPALWGKDYGALAPGEGNPLYNERSVRVVCLEPDGVTLKKPAAELPTSKFDPPVLPFEALKTGRYERHPRFAYPTIGLDGRGHVWLASRHNFGSRYTSHPGAIWSTFVRRLDGERWSEPLEVHHSDGLLDHRPVLLPHAGGGLLVVHNTDGRGTTPTDVNNQVYAGVLDLAASASSPRLIAHRAGENQITNAVEAEAKAVERMRTHRVAADGKNFRFHRGEYHRHTEISWDGAPDGSLEDMFRYAIDAVAFDWIGNGDHDNGAGREYSWWLTQKFTDAYRVGDRFVPMFTYERSVAYPHGHRNVMFAQRGMRTLPRLAPPEGKKAEGGVHPDDTKMLYRYLHEHNGLCAVHTSATGMGTDWRDNDPVVEPIVEIYQGDRMSYEHEDAPRAGYDPATPKLPANVAGWFPKGFINHALGRGYKLGFQASSDHWSTHISFFIILAEKNDRRSLLDAVKARRCYGATDNILVDWRSGATLMGGETTGAPTFQLHTVGTGPLAKVEILRDSAVVAQLPAKGVEYRGEWTDPQPPPGTHYYYARILQADGEIAWASPIWVHGKK